jgi:hypothetical protein
MDLFLYLSDADFPTLEKRPISWPLAVKALHNQMTTHVVIVATSVLFHVQINIIDWEGVSWLIV